MELDQLLGVAKKGINSLSSLLGIKKPQNDLETLLGVNGPKIANSTPMGFIQPKTAPSMEFPVNPNNPAIKKYTSSTNVRTDTGQLKAGAGSDLYLTEMGLTPKSSAVALGYQPTGKTAGAKELGLAALSMANPEAKAGMIASKLPGAGIIEKGAKLFNKKAGGTYLNTKEVSDIYENSARLQKVIDKVPLKKADKLIKAEPLINEAKKKESLKQIYHGTDKIFKEFDVNMTPDGSIWFSDNLNLIKAGGVGASGNKRIIKRFIDENKLKLAGWDEYEKYSLDQLQNMGYDGIKLPDAEKIDYQIFYPEKLKKSIK